MVKILFYVVDDLKINFFLITFFYREDFVRPLREGIKEYQSLHDDGGVGGGRGGHGGRRARKLKDVKIYHNVAVLNPVCAHGGIQYRIRFDASRMKHVKWQVTYCATLLRTMRKIDFKDASMIEMAVRHCTYIQRSIKF